MSESILPGSNHVIVGESISITLTGIYERVARIAISAPEDVEIVLLDSNTTDGSDFRNILDNIRDN